LKKVAIEDEEKELLKNINMKIRLADRTNGRALV